MLKPLYLSGREKTEVILDGPALRIARSACADLRMPFRRISRIVVSGSVNWANNALLACADNNVPIIFLRGDGSVRARWLGAQSRQGDLQQRWSHFIDRPDWKELYEDWRAPAYRRSLVLSARRLGMCSDYSERNLKELLTSPIRVLMGETAWSRLHRRLSGLVESKTVACLVRSGLDSSDTASATLVADLGEVVAIGLLPELNRAFCGETASSSFPGEKDMAIVSLFEQHRATADFHLRIGIQSFCRFLESLD